MVERGTHIVIDEHDFYITDVPRVHTCCETCDLLGCPAQHELECDNVGATDSSGRFYPWARLEERWGTEAVERIRSIVEERYREAGRYDEDGSFDCGWT